MKPFTIQAFRELIGHRGAPAISMYLPTGRGFPDSRQNTVRYRDLVRRAGELLKPHIIERDGASRWLGKLESLLTPEFWAHPLDGLAVFVGPGVEVYYRLPRTVPEDVFVGDTFYTRPLMNFLRINRRFYVLALSKRKVMLFAGDPFGLQPAGMSGVPANIEEALGDEVTQDSLRFHSGGTGRAGAVFTGQGAGEDDERQDLERYFRVVDRSLRRLLAGETAPVLLATVVKHHSIYRSVSRLPNLAEASLTGNFDTATAEQIYAAARPVILPELEAQEDQVLALHEKLAGAGRATDNLDEMGRAVIAGRIQHLLLEENARVAGRLDPQSGAVDSGEDGKPSDVLDDLAEQTLLRGGETIVLPAARMPLKRPAIAALRW